MRGRDDARSESRIVLVYQTPQRRNAELILRHSTACPFKTRFSQILCVYCHTEYALLPELRYHMQSEHANADFKSVFYRMKGNLIKVDISELGCKLCREPLSDVESLMRHFSQQHGLPVKLNACYGVLPYRLRDGRWVCVCCERSYGGFVDYKRHVSSHYMDHNCDRCGTAFVSRHALRDHQRQVKCHRVAYKPRNGRSTRPRGNAEIILRCSTAYPFRMWMSNINCVFCTTKTRDPTAFRDHMATQHAAYDVQAAFYKKLGKAFLSVDITDLRCKLCTAPIDGFDHLVEHLMKEHRQPIRTDAQPGVLPFRLGDGTVWRCAMCTDRFKDLLSLKRHTHGHFQNYVCDACGEGFITESAMVAHSRTPHENKYSCSRCVATFRSLMDRDAHVKSQHTSTPYVCSYCEQRPRFATWEARKRHLLEVHNYGSAVDGYECALCRKRFKSRSGKYNHVARVHRVIKDSGSGYTCASCSRTFTSQLFLDKHVAKKHGDA
ncbi:unnamed protein product, partial [Iphiclides podalirius]